MIDPLVSLAFSMHSSRGVYALFLGSGISTAAKIPTGWMITLDLVRQLAEVMGEKPEPTAEEWFKKKFATAPDYSKLLDELFKSPADRQAALRGYIEPTEDQKNAGERVPTRAHRAIARLIRDRFIRMVITSNFDRLLEQALAEVNVHPTVISTVDQLKGAQPPIHSRCTIVKVNGDYLDDRIRNTEYELKTYDAEMNTFVDRLLDEFGLIISGWSAEWDLAMRDAFFRCANRRYATYWNSISDPGESANKVIDHRAAQVIKKDADTFFTELEEKVGALSRLDAPHPLSARIATELAKTLVEGERWIRIHDLFFRESTSILELIDRRELRKMSALEFSSAPEEIAVLSAASDVLTAVTATVCRWTSAERCGEYVRRTLQMLANDTELNRDAWDNLVRWPALNVFYAVGLAAVSSKRLDWLDLLWGTDITDGSERHAANLLLHPLTLDTNLQAIALPQHPVSFRFSDELRERLLPIFAEYLADEREFDTMFDRFELAISVSATRRRAQLFKDVSFVFGRFIKRWHFNDELRDSMLKEATELLHPLWEWILRSSFDGNREEFASTIAEIWRIAERKGWNVK
jgi:hypothetical protein